MARYSHASGIPLIVISIPQQFQVHCFENAKKSAQLDVALYDKHFMQVAEENSFTWVPTLSHFVESNQNTNELYYRLDGHLKSNGNSIVANVFVKNIAPMLEQLKHADSHYDSISIGRDPS